jgi:N-acylglucosamine-6-phosphate 2-epimerase
LNLKRGIIVSIQGYKQGTNYELAKEAVSAGASGIKTDKPVYFQENEKSVPIIGCYKIKVQTPAQEAYLTPTVELIKQVSEWCDYVSVDYRKINKNLPEISKYCRDNKIKVIADIGLLTDYKNIKENNYYYDFIATTFSVFYKHFRPDLRLLKQLKNNNEKYILAEGNFSTRAQVKEAYEAGIDYICIGAAISNVYKLTRKFVTVGKDA